jgi:hypothetical protein
LAYTPNGICNSVRAGPSLLGRGSLLALRAMSAIGHCRPRHCVHAAPQRVQCDHVRSLFNGSIRLVACHLPCASVTAIELNAGSKPSSKSMTIFLREVGAVEPADGTSGTRGSAPVARRSRSAPRGGRGLIRAQRRGFHWVGQSLARRVGEHVVVIRGRSPERFSSPR